MIRPIGPLRNAWAYTRSTWLPRSGRHQERPQSSRRSEAATAAASAAGRPAGRTGRLPGNSALPVSTAPAMLSGFRFFSLAQEDHTIADTVNVSNGAFAT